MSATMTAKSFILSTALAVPLLGFQPVELAAGTEFDCNTVVTRVEIPNDFEAGFKMIDHKIVRSNFDDEVRGINSLLEIGNILFKDSRDETSVELKAKRAYFKSKYKKV